MVTDMDIRKRIALLSSLCILCATSLYAQLPPSLENVSIVENDTACFVRYTNNAWRNEARALLNVLDSMLHIAPQKAWYINVCRNDVPTLLVAAPACDNRPAQITGQFVETLTFSFEALPQKIFNQSKTQNRNAGKIALVFYPLFSVQNVTYDQVWQSRLDIAPTLEINLWQGARFTGQVLLPVYNDMYSSEGNYVRPGIISIVQDYKLPRQFFGHVAVGNFTGNRIGVELGNYWQQKKGEFTLGYKASFTTGSYFDYGSWWVNNALKVSAHAIATWTPQRYNMELQLMAGRYVYGDYGVEAAFTRRFSNVSFTLYGRYSGNTADAGFSFSVPMWLRKQKREKQFLVSAPVWYQWRYMQRLSSTSGKSNGHGFSTDASTTPMSHYLNPYYIKNELQLLLNP